MTDKVLATCCKLIMRRDVTIIKIIPAKLFSTLGHIHSPCELSLDGTIHRVKLTHCFTDNGCTICGLLTMRLK